MNYANHVNTAAGLARAAGELIKSHFRGDFKKGCKSCPSDHVTEIDCEAEALITNGLLAKFPDHIVIGEEDGQANEHAQDGFTWYVDPLDGTTNFVYGIPFCSVSIGLSYSGRMVAGVVYDPFHDECFSASKGGGAFLNGSSIRVDPSRSRLSDALLVTGYPADKEFSKRLLKIDYYNVIHRCSNLRALGSAALELAYVACGRLTGFWENPLMPWDVAAGSLLVEEAGGMVTGIDGNHLKLKKHLSIVASNTLIHGELIQALTREHTN